MSLPVEHCPKCRELKTIRASLIINATKLGWPIDEDEDTLSMVIQILSFLTEQNEKLKLIKSSRGAIIEVEK